jgi:hypothetical protein
MVIQASKRKMSMSSNKLLMWLVALSMILACVPTVPTPFPTLDPEALKTYIVQTARAASTQTAASRPSSTPTATSTPTPRNTGTSTPTATTIVVFILSTPTPLVAPTFTGVSGGNSSSNFACQVISVDPANGSVFNPRTDFDGTWTVKNIGKKTWDHNSVDYVYSSGAKFHKVSGYDLGKDLARGETANITVDMEAPKNPGTYSTIWAIRETDNSFCILNLTIVVK